jgi:RimJ/RimL family protein N-acetyltransferase
VNGCPSLNDEAGEPLDRVARVNPPRDLPTFLLGQEVVLRPLRVNDVEHVAEIQAQAAVARWWGPPGEVQLYRLAEGREDERAFAIEREGELVGLIQFREEKEPDFRHAAIDLFLDERHQGRGLGSDAVASAFQVPDPGPRPSPADDRPSG